METITINIEKYTSPQGGIINVIHHRNEADDGSGVFSVRKHYHRDNWRIYYEELSLSQLRKFPEADLIASAILDNNPALLSEDTLSHRLLVGSPYGGDGLYPLPKLIEKHPFLAGELLSRLAG